MSTQPIDTVIIGGGMITYDLILPSVYHLQRTGTVGNISICALNSQPLNELKDSQEILQAFPDQTFTPYPAFDEPADNSFPELYKEAISSMKPRQLVIVAVPDQFHNNVVLDALNSDQHVLCVKPLVLKHAQAEEIRQLAHQKGLFVGIEYHKRFDRRSLIARRQYQLGHFGDFVMGEAKLIEPYFYRDSNFQTWFTTDKTDPFVYVGCHYVDLVYFITGLKPVELSVTGVEGSFPNGNTGYMWANGRIVYENGAILSVSAGLGYPNEGAGSNDQGLLMFCEGNKRSGMIQHDDQYRGVRHSYQQEIGCGGSHYNYINPDFYRLVPWDHAGFKPVGYGYDSIEANVTTAHRIENSTAEMSDDAGLAKRRKIIEEVDNTGIIATPANSSINELVIEAARLSIENKGAWATIHHGDNPHATLR